MNVIPNEESINAHNDKYSTKGLFTAAILFSIGIVQFVFDVGPLNEPYLKYSALLIWSCSGLVMLIRSFFPPLDLKAGFVTVIGVALIVSAFNILMYEKFLPMFFVSFILGILFIYVGFKHPKKIC